MLCYLLPQMNLTLELLIKLQLTVTSLIKLQLTVQVQASLYFWDKKKMHFIDGVWYMSGLQSWWGVIIYYMSSLQNFLEKFTECSVHCPAQGQGHMLTAVAAADDFVVCRKEKQTSVMSTSSSRNCLGPTAVQDYISASHFVGYSKVIGNLQLFWNFAVHAKYSSSVGTAHKLQLCFNIGKMSSGRDTMFDLESDHNTVSCFVILLLCPWCAWGR